MSLQHENGDYGEKHAVGAPAYDHHGKHDGHSSDPEAAYTAAVPAGTNALHQDLKGRHMQMIAMQVSRPVLYCALCN